MSATATWIPLRPTLKSCCVEDVRFMTPREAWLAMSTIRRWFERGHAARVARMGRDLMTVGEVGIISGVTVVYSK